MSELAQTEVQAASVSGLSPDTAGLTPPRDPDRRGVFLSDVITELGFADDEQLEVADRAARDSGKPLELVLLENGTLDEDQLSRAVAERNGLDHVDLDEFEVDMSAAELVGRSMAERYEAVPIAFAPEGALVVAVQDVFDTLGVSDISELTRSEVRRVVVAPGQLRPLIGRLPDEPPPQPVEPESPPEVENALPESPPAVENALPESPPAVESDLLESPENGLVEPVGNDLPEPDESDPPRVEEVTVEDDVVQPLGVDSAEEPDLSVSEPPPAPEVPSSPGPPPNAPKIFTDEVTPPSHPPFTEPSTAPPDPEPTDLAPIDEEPAVEEELTVDKDPAVEEEPPPTEEDPMDSQSAFEPQSEFSAPEPEAFQPLPDLPQPASELSQPEPEPSLPADTELADLTAELRALREIAGRADALAVSVGNRIEGLEEAAGRAERLEHERDERDERIEQLQRDLDAAKSTSTELEGRLSGVGDAAEELNAATETLRQLQQALEQTAR